MVKLYENGVYLLHGRDIIEDGPEAAEKLRAKNGHKVLKTEAAEQTISYRILKKHNVSDNMEDLNIKFDKLTSHDITFVGIIQTARASGLERFPIPYVLTNCHNSLCAVGGTINEDDHMFGLTCAKKIRRCLCAAPPGSHTPVRKRDAGRMREDDSWIRQPYSLWGAWHHGDGRGRTGACQAASE